MLKKTYFQYGAISDAQAQFIASHFDWVAVDYRYNKVNGVSTHLKLKLINPNLKLLQYVEPNSLHPTWTPDAWAIVDTHEDWFLHDTRGNTKEYRLVTKLTASWSAGWYWLDSRKPEVQDFFAQFWKSRLDSHPEFDGLFVDSYGAYFGEWERSGFTVDKQYVPSMPSYHNDMIAKAKKGKALIGSKILMLNIQEAACLDYLTVGNADAGMFESFAHGYNLAPDQWNIPWGYPEDPPILKTLATSGKWVFPMSGCNLSSPADVAPSLEVAKTCLCLALLACEDTSHLGFGIINNVAMPEYAYIPEMDFDFGVPVESTVILATDVFKRAFTKAVVCVNMSPNAYTFTHQGKNYVIQPKSSLIIDLALPTKYMFTHITYFGGPLTDADAKFVADHFDVLIGDAMNQGNTIVLPKNYKSSIIVLSYRSIWEMHSSYSDWNEVNSHEDWFLHETDGVTRLRIDYFLSYAMDVANQGWRDHYIAYIKSVLQTYPNIDGIFADGGQAKWENWFFTQKDKTKIPDHPNWHNDMLAMIQQVKTALGNKLFAVNSNDYTGDYLSECDGQMLEGFMHGSWSAVDEWPDDPYSWLQPFRNLTKLNKYVFPLTGTKPDSEEKTHAIALYGLASAYIASDGSKPCFGFHKNVTDVYTRYIPEMDIDLGMPSAPVQLATDVWSRSFEKGKVYANFGLIPYQTSEGITLQPHSGLILETAVKHTLAYQSTPVAVPLSLDGQQLLSGQSVQIEEGKTVTIKVPAEVEVA